MTPDQVRISSAPIIAFGWLRQRAPSFGHSIILPAVSLLNAVVGLCLPTLFGPEAFGQYALTSSLFQYALVMDLGTSQMFDRRVPALIGQGRHDEAARYINELLWLRLFIAIGACTFLATATIGLMAYGAAGSGAVPWVLSVLAGLLFMVGNGPASVYRAESRPRSYALTVLLLNLGLILARPGGAILLGVEGCFGAMALWYLGCAAWLQGQIPLRAAWRPSAATMRKTIQAGLPLFATSLTWAFFTSANRWFASFVTDAVALGQFAFGANILYLVSGMLGGLSAFYYPSIAKRIAVSEPFSCSATIRKDCLRLTVAVALLSMVGILAAPLFISIVYPAFMPAALSTSTLLIATTPLTLAAWLMPLSISSGRHPWLACLVVYPLAVAVLGETIFELHAHFGLPGIAAASSVAGMVLTGLQLSLLRLEHIMKARDGAVLWCAMLAVIVMLGAVATL